MARVLEARSDVVGSLLRPPELLAARDRFEKGELGATELKQAEDAAVDEVLRLQEDAGWTSSPTERCGGCRSRAR